MSKSVLRFHVPDRNRFGSLGAARLFRYLLNLLENSCVVVTITTFIAYTDRHVLKNYKSFLMLESFFLHDVFLNSTVTVLTLVTIYLSILLSVPGL